MTQHLPRTSGIRARALLVLWVCAAMCALFWAAPAWSQDQPAESAPADDSKDESEADDSDDTDDSDPNDFEEEEESNLVTAEPRGEGDPKIEWFPGWEAGVRAGWMFTSLDPLNPIVNDPNGAAPFDAVGVLRLEATAGTYVSKQFMLRAFGGAAFTMGGESGWTGFYGGIDPALVFAEHRFEFLLGLRVGFGGYTIDMVPGEGNPGPLVGDGGYEGSMLVIEPYLNYRHIVSMNFAVDVSFGFWQTFALSENATGGAQEIDNILAQPEDRPLDWVAPNITLGFVFGEMPTRPERPLDPDGDKDGDGIINKDDECPKEAEDEDGFEDEDGCPDLDNDKDGVEDSKDKCVDEPEDKDGVMDEDGCPETDGDGDKILDEVDKCPAEAEDFDKFEDEDGCPDLDNDKDGIEDAKDKCPNTPEDKDGKSDEDGCPDLDDDGDWILEPADQCPEKPEVFNGVSDTDGCPEDDKGLVFYDYNEKVFKTRIPLRYPSTMKDIDKNIKDHLDQLAVIMKGAPQFERVQLEVHTDNSKKTPEDNRAWSMAIGKAMRDYLISKGVDAKRVVASGKGDMQPAKDLTGLKGKELREASAYNRRIVIKAIKRAPTGNP